MSARMDSLKTRRVAAGFTIPELARRSNTSDLTIQKIENGDGCDPVVEQRLLDAIAASVGITSSSVANPSQVTCAADHNLVTNDTVVIANHTGSTPTINGTRVVTKVNASIVSVPINVTIGGTGGTITITAASLGKAQL